jgi:hypothetical protein
MAAASSHKRRHLGTILLLLVSQHVEQISGWCPPVTRSALRPRALLSCSSSAAPTDPFRARKRPPIEPIAINAIVKALQLPEGAALGGVIDDALAKRAHDPDAALLADEERLLREWIGETLGRRQQYASTLATLASGEPFFQQELGMGPDDNPYVMLCRAECMLALYLLNDAGGDARRAVAFIDADRLKVLANA